MHKRFQLYALLAMLGFYLGPRLVALAAPDPQLELDFGSQCERAALSPDGRWVAGLLKTPEGWSVGIADAYGGPGIAPVPVPDPPARVNTFAWHSSSRWLAFGCANQVRLFDTQSGNEQILAANPMVRQVLFRGDLLFARANECVYLWNVKTGQQIFRLELAYLVQADLSADGKTLALGCFGEGVRLVSVRSKRVLRHLADGYTAASVAFCRNDGELAVALRSGDAAKDQARLFNVSSGRPSGPSLSQPQLRGMVVSSDGNRMLLRSDDLVTVWEPSNGKKISSRAAQSRLIDGLSPDGKLAASTPPGKAEVEVWNTETGQTLCRLDHPRFPSQASFSSKDRLEVVGDRYRLWLIR